MNWLKDEVGLTPYPLPGMAQPGILVLTHHQYITAFNGEEEFQETARQLQSVLPPGREVIWINGHEHRFAIYNKYRQSPEHITAWVRCIGNGGMSDEHSKDRYPIPEKITSRGLLLYDRRVADTFHFDFADPLNIGFNGYVKARLNGDLLKLTYCSAYWNGDPKTRPFNEDTITETWQADSGTGAINLLEMTDHTKGSDGQSKLTYPK